MQRLTAKRAFSLHIQALHQRRAICAQATGMEMVMLALKQQHGLLGGIYVIPDEHPIGYTHLYCPECRFDEVIHEENWIFLRKETGYLALWCSEKLEAHNGMNFNCEQRAYSKNAAYLCVCGGQKSDVSFATFKNVQKNVTIL